MRKALRYFREVERFSMDRTQEEPWYFWDAERSLEIYPRSNHTVNGWQALMISGVDMALIAKEGFGPEAH